MNYLLMIGNEKLIISSEEYAKIQEGIKNKSNLIFLRGGKVCVNPMMIKLIKETNEPTQEQEEKYQEQLRLPPEQREQKSITGNVSRPAVANSNWYKIGDDKDWKKCKICGVSHFIPEGKELCLGCMAK